jgi:hypothetical protein
MRLENKKIYECKSCNYFTSRKSQMDRHLETKKHNFRKYNQILPKKFHCECGKIYKHRSSLFNHKKKCDYIGKETNYMHNETKNKCEIIQVKEDTNDTDSLSDKQLILKLLEKNDELVKTIQTMAPRIGNNNNNKFNLNFFLNEQCKGAINLTDFVNSLKVQIDDLEYTQLNGFTKGITNVIVNGLKSMDMYTRPIHCTDPKRTTMYVKDHNGWEKDNEYEKIKDSIASLNKKHIAAIKAWEAEHPGWEKNDHMTEEYMKMVRSVTDHNPDNNNIIIKQVAKEVGIDKED